MRGGSCDSEVGCGIAGRLGSLHVGANALPVRITQFVNQTLEAGIRVASRQQCLNLGVLIKQWADRERFQYKCRLIACGMPAMAVCATQGVESSPLIQRETRCTRAGASAEAVAQRCIESGNATYVRPLFFVQQQRRRDLRVIAL